MNPESDAVAVVTGANTGLGFETALGLARTGASVVMACRSLERAGAARSALLARVPAASATILPLDVSEPESIREFGRQLAERFDRLDLLVNNAGVVGVALSRNSAGHEMHLATNHLGAFALTGTVLPLLCKSAAARVVNVGSLSHRVARLDLADPNWERTPYNEWKAYARSKIAMVGFTMELNRRLRESGSRVVALGAHPGFAATEVGRNSAALNPGNAFGRWVMERIRPLVPAPEEAARPILHAARDAGAAGGDYFGPSGLLEIRGKPGRARVHPIARDVAFGRRLWALSESLTGVRYLSDL